LKKVFAGYTHILFDKNFFLRVESIGVVLLYVNDEFWLQDVGCCVNDRLKDMIITH